MNVESVRKMLEQLGNQSWEWGVDSWPRMVSYLGLQPKEEVGERATYLFPDSLALDVYSHDGHIEAIEVTVDEFLESENLDEISYEDMVDEYYGKFREAVSVVSAEFGRPLFCNGAGASDFPDDQDAVWLACWSIANARLMIQQKHEDRELPFRICVVVAPPVL